MSRAMSKALKGTALVVLIAAAIVVLFTTVFPWVESMQQDPTLGATSGHLESGHLESVQATRSPR